jgi:hypothetical protein
MSSLFSLRRFTEGRSSVVILVISSLLFFAAFTAWLTRPHVYSAATLGAVIPISSIEAAFVEDTIREALRVASPVVVVYSDHLSDGTREDLGYVERLRATLGAERGVLWVPVAWFPGPSSRFWIRYLRWAGFPFLTTDFVLWLDADEVLDAPRFAEWWRSRAGLPATGRDALKLANYVYFRETRYQSEQLEDSVVVTRRAALLRAGGVARFFSDDFREREMFFDGLGGARMVAASDGVPMVHHFSWVRSKALMLQKVKAWGHTSDAENRRDWVQLVEEEWRGPFKGVDFVNGHTYRTLPTPWIDALRKERAAGK